MTPSGIEPTTFRLVKYLSLNNYWYIIRYSEEYYNSNKIKFFLRAMNAFGGVEL
jgi:hypothetical protein